MNIELIFALISSELYVQVDLMQYGFRQICVTFQIINIRNIKPCFQSHTTYSFATVYYLVTNFSHQYTSSSGYIQEHGCISFFSRDSPPVGPGFLIRKVSKSHTTTKHSRYDSSGWVISSSQRPLPDNTQQLQQTNIHAAVEFEPTVSADERPQIYALERAATGIGDMNANGT